MRIGVDYTLARAHAPGVGRYVRELVRALVRLPDAPPLHLVELGRFPAAMPDSALGLAGAAPPAVHRRVRVPRRLIDAAAALGVGADRWAGRVDLFHQAHAFGPRVRAACEVIPVSELPASGSDAERRLQARLRNAAAVLVFTPHFVDRIADRYAVDPTRIHVVPVGCDHWRRDLDEEVPPVDPPRVLVLGAMRPSRRPDLVLEALERLDRRGLRASLYVAGRRTEGTHQFRRALDRSPVRGLVTWRVPEERELPRIVAESAVLVHLNEQDEGTPVTPLEAMSFGVPVVGSRRRAFEAALGDDAELLDDPSSESLAEAIAARIVGGDATAVRRRLVERAAAFTWERNARATLAVWREVGRARRPEGYSSSMSS